jgi:signal transduction histidine kinase
MIESQLARMRIVLDDLAAAQHGGRAAVQPRPQDLKPLALAATGGIGHEVRAEWDAGVPRVVADRARLAQALGNLLANADEHGEGPVELRGRRVPGALRVEVRNATGRPSPSKAGRGRGLRIAEEAVAQAGGSLELRREGKRFLAALELPVAPDDGPKADAA